MVLQRVNGLGETYDISHPFSMGGINDSCAGGIVGQWPSGAPRLHSIFVRMLILVALRYPWVQPSDIHGYLQGSIL